jgi:hypothetical protein
MIVLVFQCFLLELWMVRSYDSRGVRYTQGVDFNIDNWGNIAWIEGANNPGMDPDTGAGRTYSYSLSLPSLLLRD